MRNPHKLFEIYGEGILNHNDYEELDVLNKSFTNLSVIFKQLFDEYEKEFGLDYNNPVYGDIQTTMCDLNMKVFRRKNELNNEINQKEITHLITEEVPMEEEKSQLEERIGRTIPDEYWEDIQHEWIMFDYGVRIQNQILDMSKEVVIDTLEKLEKENK